MIEMNNDADPTYQIDLETGKLAWNEAFYDVFGYTRSEPADSMEWWSRHIHPEDAMLVNNAMDQLTTTQRTEWIVAYRFKKADGSYVLATDHVSIKRDYAGEATSLTGVITLEDNSSTQMEH